MENYEVSIIVPVYNRESIIKPCVESINSQTYDKSKWEVIFVDDASTDNTINTIESLIDKSINCRIIKRTVGSGNASAPRNEGIKASSSKYIFFLDSDDYVDSQLLENGMEMALKNDSDIVYVKIKGINRKTPIRPFKINLVNYADVLKNHLVRSLGPMKFIKLDLINKNNILFIQSIDKAEDQVFTMHALTKADNISILSDKDYYNAISHEGEHLSRKAMSIESFYQTIYMPLSYIYVVSNNKNYDKKKKLYNAWLIKSVERIRNITKKIKINDEDFRNMFQLTSSYFNIHRELFDLSQIYENEKVLTLLFLAGDFAEFHKLANKSKVIKSLHTDIQKEFESEPGFSRAWIYKNKVTVLDFTLNNNKIAFDLEVNEKEKTLKVWILSRNNPSSLEVLRNNAIEVVKHRFLIFNGKINARKEAMLVIKYSLNRVRDA